MAEAEIAPNARHLVTVRRYLDCLHRGDTAGLIALFAPDGNVVSPFLGTMPAREFFPKLAQSSSGSVITLLGLYAGAEPDRAAAHFRYDWTLRDGKVATFNCVDLFSFEAAGSIQSMTIVYDTHPIRADVGDKYA
jgi:ketosteroid isomerase-like protein